MRRFRRAWGIAGLGRQDLDDIGTDLDADDDAPHLRRHIDSSLSGKGGDVSARARAARLGELYYRLSPAGRARFMSVLANDYDVEKEAVDSAILRRQTAQDPVELHAAEQALRTALLAPRLALLTQFNSLDQGVKFLVDMRADLMEMPREPALTALDMEFRDLLTAWFDIGFLELRRITWDTPAALLEKLIAYEAVHEIQSWDDLKNRLDSDRRCYAFFHLGMPDEPLIFVEVALVQGLSDNVQRLLDEEAPAQDPEEADTAIFYSISNCQKGLSGISFGNFLIKQVVGDLTHDLPNLKTFATLSPIPGLAEWFDGAIDVIPEKLATPAEARLVKAVARRDDTAKAVKSLLAADGWQNDHDIAQCMEPILTRAAAFYLLKERRGHRVHDRVAHFHLTNGARLECINWRADTSPRGLAQSAGMMVNYRYKLDEIERNHESYTGDHRIVATTAVRRLLKV